MAYVSYFEKYKRYYDSLNGQESIVGKSQALANDISNRINIIKNSYFNMINESKWQESGKNIVATQIISGLKSEINKINFFVKNNLCKACDLAINGLLANVKIIKDEDEKLKIMYDELAALIDEYSHTPQYNGDWIYKKDVKGKVHCVYRTTDNLRYIELGNAINNQNININSKESYIKTLCENANDTIDLIFELNGSFLSENIDKFLQSLGLINSNYPGLDELVDLKGDELLKFQNYNSIPKEGTAVKKTEALINGVLFPIYYIYDTTYKKDDNNKFFYFSMDSLAYANKIDTKVLKQIRDNGTCIIFEQSSNCDEQSKKNGSYVAAAYYNPNSRNVAINYPLDKKWNDPCAASVVHELGHAYDFLLGTQSDIIKIFPDHSLSSNIYLSDIFIKPISWGRLIEKDAANMLNAGGTGFSYCTLDNLRIAPSEYFASVFSDYYMSPDKNQRLQFIAPSTYEAMDKLISSSINGAS